VFQTLSSGGEGVRISKYSSFPISTSNTFQDLPRLRETADKTERYI
jgi:hypothetical protein